MLRPYCQAGQVRSPLTNMILELAGPYACQLLQGLQAARGPGPSEPPAKSISISAGCMHVHIWSSHSIAQWLC